MVYQIFRAISLTGPEFSVDGITLLVVIASLPLLNSLILDFDKEFFELSIKSFSSLFLDQVWILVLLSIDEIDVVILQSLVLEFPISTSIFVEVDLEFFHIFFELNLPSWLKVDLMSNFVWNIRDIEKNHNHVWLLPSGMLTGKSHAFMWMFLINMLFRVAIFNQLFSLWNKSTNIVKFTSVMMVWQNLVPWGSLNSSLW